LAASLFLTDRVHPAVTFVAELDETTIARVRREALALRIRHRTPVTVELHYVADGAARALIATLADLATHEVQIVTTPIGGGATSPTVPAAQLRPAAPTSEPDPFGLDRELRARSIPLFRFLFERYWRIEVSGIEHVPATGPALLVANHSGAVPADAFMLATALELRHPEPRCLRVLFDKFVDALPFIGELYRRLGGVTASFANAESLLRRGELVGLFPEGLAGAEKLYFERYRLRPFKTGTARLSLRTGSPIVPVAIVGAEEAYPVIARLYRAGRLVGLPWIPVTPLFPVCGVAGGLPLPSKWAMHFGAPILPPPADGRSEDERVTALTARVRAAIETSLHALLAKRVGIFL
jgi:1-acyl-sn-glycerol-3-phosphate acyltransferase